VRKGEKTAHVEFWEVKPGQKRDENGEDDDMRRACMVHRVHSVFIITRSKSTASRPSLSNHPRTGRCARPANAFWLIREGIYTMAATAPITGATATISSCRRANVSPMRRDFMEPPGMS
jgi:hypothetical protein